MLSMSYELKSNKLAVFWDLASKCTANPYRGEKMLIVYILIRDSIDQGSIK